MEAHWNLGIYSKRYREGTYATFPEPAVFRNNKSSLALAKFVEDAIRELFESSRVIEVVVPPLVVNPSSVFAQATGK